MDCRFIKIDVFPLQLHELTPSNACVTEGLDDGEEIVVNGTFTIDAAAQLKGKKSMMNPAGGGNTGGHESHKGPGPDKNSMSNAIKNQDPDFRKQFDALIDVYLQLSEALVQSEPKSVATYAQNFRSSLSNVEMRNSKDEESRATWMELRADLQKHIDQMSDHEDLKKQRDHFKPLSALFIEGVGQFGTDQTLYSVYCPMADNNSGGYWISAKEEVINPYFGSAMLKCGAVKQKLN